jgi:hypothetical protein
MNTIEGYCRTNLDDYKREEWPRVFSAVPREGENVRSKSGKVLKVCKVTHGYDFMNNKPFIEVELTNSRNGATL